MKKKLTLFFLTLALLLFPLAPSTKAQEFNFQRAYQDYLYMFNQYQVAHKEYVAARSAYLSYQTLTAKTEAMNKTLKMLELRDETVRTYLTALRLKLAETTGISDYEESVLYLKLDHEVNWYHQHRDSLSSAGSLADLVEISEDAQDQYQESETLAFQTLGTILAGKLEDLRHQLKDQIVILDDKIDEIRQRRDKKTDILERWLLEAENKLTRSQEKQFEALQIIGEMTAGKKKKTKLYGEARFSFQEANQYLKEATAFLEEIIREVKIAD